MTARVARVDGVGIVDLLSGYQAPPPPPPADGLTWEQAIATRNQAEIDAWYESNTGPNALGLADGDLWNIGGQLDLTQAWLEANGGSSHVSYDAGTDRWLVQAIKCSNLRYRRSNVTVRGAHLRREGSALYGAQYYGTTSTNSAYSGARLEYATLDGNFGTSFATYFGTTTPTGEDTTVIENCRMFGWRAGGTLLTGSTMRRCYVHDLYIFEGSHNTGASVRGSDVKVLQNNLKDGTSAAFSMYADELLNNVTVDQNVFNTANALFCVAFTNKEFANVSTNTRLRNNIFGQEYFATCGQNAPAGGVERFTEVSGNTFMDGTPVP